MTTIEPNDLEGLEAAGAEDARPWRRDDFEPDWMKKLREKHPEVLAEAEKPAPEPEPEPEPVAAEPEETVEPAPPEKAPFRMSDADTSMLPQNVEARDLCSLGSGSARRYTAGVRMEALQYFERGWGYKATAGFLHLPYYTVREWKRLYKQGKFSRERIEAELAAAGDLFETPEPANYAPAGEEK